MSSLALFAALGIASAPLRAADDPESRVFVELLTERDRVYVQELVELRVRIGVEEEFLRESLVQLFPQELDVPVQLQGDWLHRLDGAELLVDPEAESAGPHIVIGDAMHSVRSSEEQRDGRSFTVLEFERRFLPTVAGALTFAPPRLRYAWATSFHEDFFGDRVPDDRHDASVEGTAHALQVLPWPELGRPPDFAGAVGRFTVRAEVDAGTRVADESFELRVVVEGRGNLGFFAAPRLEDLSGFHVFGLMEDAGPSRRTFRYDLAWTDESVRSLPPIDFDYFDPGPPPGYHRLRTEAIAMGPDVPPEEPAAPPVDRSEGWTPVPGVDQPHGLKDSAGEAPAREPLLGWQLSLGLGFPWLALVGAWVWRRVRDRERPDPLDLRARAAAARFRREGGRELHEAFAEYLAARLRSPRPAVIGPGLSQRLGAAGIDEGLSARSAELLETLVAARYGGEAPADAQAASQALVDELEREFVSKEPRT